MPWDIENYHIIDGRILNVEISIPLLEFLYTKIDDVKDAWMEMLGQFISEEPGVEMSWEMQPRGENAIVTIQIAKPGDLATFTDSEARGALGAVDALFDKKDDEAKKKSRKSSTKDKTETEKKSASKETGKKTTAKKKTSTKKK